MPLMSRHLVTHDCKFSNECPKRLKCLVSEVKCSKGNFLLHQFVLDNSYPNASGSEIYIKAVLYSFCSAAMNRPNGDGYSPLHLAVLKKNLPMLRKMFSCMRNVNVNAVTFTEHSSALHLAARLFEPPSARDLIYNGFRARSNSGVSPAYLDVIRFLLEKGIDVNRRNLLNETPLLIAARLGDLDLTKLLLNHGADGGIALLCKTTLSNPEVLDLLLEKGTNVNCYDDGHSPLHLAMYHCDLEVIQALVEHGAYMNLRDELGYTVLHFAVRNCHRLVVEFLVKKGADVNIKDSYDRTVLHYLPVLCNPDLIRFLVHNGANVNTKDSRRSTPLHTVVSLSNKNLKQFCQDIHPSMLHPSPNLTILDIVKVLVASGADVNERDSQGRTALALTLDASWNNSDVVKFLVQKGACFK